MADNDYQQGNGYQPPENDSHSEYYQAGNGAQEYNYNPAQPNAQQNQGQYYGQQGEYQQQQGQYYQPPQGEYQQYNYQPTPGYAQPPVEEKASVGLAILSFLIPLAGLIIFLVDREKRPKTAKVSGICALVSFLLGICISVIMSIVGAALGTSAIDNMSDSGAGSDIISEFGNDDSDGAYTSDVSGEKTAGQYDFTIKSAELCTDYEGKDALLVTYGFTNNSDQSTCFYLALTAQAFQNGEELQVTITDDESDEYSEYTDIQPGASQDVKVVYALNDTTTPVDLQVSSLLSNGADAVTTTVTLTEE